MKSSYPLLYSLALVASVVSLVTSPSAQARATRQQLLTGAINTRTYLVQKRNIDVNTLNGATGNRNSLVGLGNYYRALSRTPGARAAARAFNGQLHAAQRAVRGAQGKLTRDWQTVNNARLSRRTRTAARGAIPGDRQNLGGARQRYGALVNIQNAGRASARRLTNQINGAKGAVVHYRNVVHQDNRRISQVNHTIAILSPRRPAPAPRARRR